jgi:hypothetical protein
VTQRRGPNETAKIDLVGHGGAGFRTFVNIATLWELSVQEQVKLLSIDITTFENLKARTSAHENVQVPMDVVVRLGCVLSIYASLVTLFPPERTGDWLRVPNGASIFNGISALEVMTTGELGDLRNVVNYLLSQIHGLGAS